MRPRRIAIVCGGPSAEANVSRASARAVRAALEQAEYECRVHELDGGLFRALIEHAPDVVFPVTHGPLGEDGCLQGLLEVSGLPFVGSGVLASALAASKPHAKALFRAEGLPLADELWVHEHESPASVFESLARKLSGSVVVKPASGGSAIATTRLAAGYSLGDLERALGAAFGVDSSALVERFVVGQEVTCGVLEDAAGPAALPPTRITSKAAHWYDFASRYAAEGSVHECPAPLAPEVTARVQAVAVAAFRTLGCRDLARVDFVVGPGGAGEGVTLLELNTLPGMTATSLYPEAAAASGIDFPALVSRLVDRAFARPRRRMPEALPMP